VATNIARSPQQNGRGQIGGTTTRRVAGSDDTSGEEEAVVRTTVTNCSRGGGGSGSVSTSQPSGMRVTAGPATSAGVDTVSMLHDSSSIQANWESRINMLVEEI
jgi:hypothetical protein